MRLLLGTRGLMKYCKCRLRLYSKNKSFVPSREVCERIRKAIEAKGRKLSQSARTSPANDNKSEIPALEMLCRALASSSPTGSHTIAAGSSVQSSSNKPPIIPLIPPENKEQEPQMQLSIAKSGTPEIFNCKTCHENRSADDTNVPTGLMLVSCKNYKAPVKANVSAPEENAEVRISKPQAKPKEANSQSEKPQDIPSDVFSMPLASAFPLGKNPCRDGPRGGSQNEGSECETTKPSPCAEKMEIEPCFSPTEEMDDSCNRPEPPAKEISQECVDPQDVTPDINESMAKSQVKPSQEVVVQPKEQEDAPLEPRSPTKSSEKWEQPPQPTSNFTFPLSAFPLGRNPCRDGPRGGNQNESSEYETTKPSPCAEEKEEIEPCFSPTEEMDDSCNEPEPPGEEISQECVDPQDVTPDIDESMAKSQVKPSQEVVVQPKEQEDAPSKPASPKKSSEKWEQPLQPTSNFTFPLSAFPLGRNPCKDGPRGGTQNESSEYETTKPSPCAEEEMEIEPCFSPTEDMDDSCNKPDPPVEEISQECVDPQDVTPDIDESMAKSQVKPSQEVVVQPKKQEDAPSKPASPKKSSEKWEQPPQPTSNFTFPLSAFPLGRNPCKDGPRGGTQNESSEYETTKLSPCAEEEMEIEPCFSPKEEMDDSCNEPEPPVKEISQECVDPQDVTPDIDESMDKSQEKPSQEVVVQPKEQEDAPSKPASPKKSSEKWKQPPQPTSNFTFPLSAFPLGRNPCRDGPRGGSQNESSEYETTKPSPCAEEKEEIEPCFSPTEEMDDRCNEPEPPGEEISQECADPQDVTPDIDESMAKSQVKPSQEVVVQPKKQEDAPSKPASPKKSSEKWEQPPQPTSNFTFPLSAFPLGRNPCKDGPRGGTQNESSEYETTKLSPCAEEEMEIEPCFSPKEEMDDSCNEPEPPVKEISQECVDPQDVTPDIDESMDKSQVKPSQEVVVQPKKQEDASLQPASPTKSSEKWEQPPQPSSNFTFPLSAFPLERNPCRDGPRGGGQNESSECETTKPSPCAEEEMEIEPCFSPTEEMDDSCNKPEPPVEEISQECVDPQDVIPDIDESMDKSQVKPLQEVVVQPKKQEDASLQPASPTKSSEKWEQPPQPSSNFTFPLSAFPLERNPCRDGPRGGGQNESSECETTKPSPCAEEMEEIEPCFSPTEEMDDSCNKPEPPGEEISQECVDPQDVTPDIDESMAKSQVKPSQEVVAHPKKQEDAPSKPASPTKSSEKWEQPPQPSSNFTFPLSAFPLERNPCRDGTRGGGAKECKEESKEESEQVCEETCHKPEPKDEPKDEQKNEPKNESKNKPKDKPQDEHKDEPKEELGINEPQIKETCPSWKEMSNNSLEKEASCGHKKPEAKDNDISECPRSEKPAPPTKEIEASSDRPARSKNVESVPKKSDQSNKIQKFPVPPLERTLTAYLASIEPFLTECEFKKELKLTEEFEKNEGKELQDLLEMAADDCSNWLTPRWTQAAYLAYQASLTVFSSPGLCFPMQKFTNPIDCLTFTAKCIRAIYEFKEMVDQKKIPVAKIGNADLDNSQFSKIFGTVRTPGRFCDTIEQYNDSDYVVVVYKYNYFKLPIISPSGELLSVTSLVDELSAIVWCPLERGEPYGLLTHDNRGNWAETYSRLCCQPGNADTINVIEESLFLVCLDDYVPVSKGEEKNVQAYQLLHGGGLQQNSANRWMDKTIQLIVNPSGLAGFCYEHSPADCQPVAMLMDFVLEKVNECGPEKSNEDENTIRASCLKFQPMTECVNLYLCAAKRNIQKITSLLQMNVFQYECYGKSFIRAQGLNPDSYIQMALQLAYYIMYQTIPAQYESAHLRMFNEGRTETIRSTSNESKAFVLAMHSDNATPAEQLKTLQDAVDAHVELTKLALTGQGIDRHLFGLQQMALENGLQLPEFFKSKGFVRSNSNQLFTSQVATTRDSFMAHGPLICDGYGCCYNPLEDKITFAISAWQTSNTINTELYGKAIKKCLDTMRRLILQTGGERVGEHPCLCENIQT